ncbi:hypothetical protein C8J57DRAFT_1496105 [Mycena rebaudengoi]|nr:hypothetical protein C8J57DRAFT_1496105 [Mycena rebaudengoi]
MSLLVWDEEEASQDNKAVPTSLLEIGADLESIQASFGSPITVSTILSTGSSKQAAAKPASSTLAVLATDASRSSCDQGLHDKAIFSAATLKAFAEVATEAFITIPDFLRMVTSHTGTITVQQIQAVKNTIQGIEISSKKEWVGFLHDYNAQGSHARTIIASQAKRFMERAPSTIGDTAHQEQILSQCEQLLGSLAEPTAVDAWLQGIVMKVLHAFLACRWHAQTTHNPNFPRHQVIRTWGATSLYSREIATAAMKIQKEMIPCTSLLHAYTCFGAMVFLDPHWDYSSFKNKIIAPVAKQEVGKVFKSLGHHEDGEHPLASGNIVAEWAIVYIISALNPDQGAKLVPARFMSKLSC